MAIIGKKSQILNALELMEGMQNALKAVFRIETPGKQMSTGWLLTPTRILVPAYTLVGARAPAVYRVQRKLDEGLPSVDVAATLAWTAPDSDHGQAYAILSLAAPMPSAPLRLNLVSPEPGSPVHLLHHARGLSLSYSAGPLLEVSGDRLFHKADTEPGSGGAPMFGVDWKVIGTHTTGGFAGSSGGAHNEGTSISAIIEQLRGCPFWDEIAKVHGLVRSHTIPESTARNPSAAIAQLRLAAAVRWSFAPDQFGPLARAELASDVVDPSADRWMLRPDVRMKVYRAAESLEALRAARGTESSDEPGQRVLDRLLAGGPFSLDAVPEAELPLWIPAVRWFTGIIPDLPHGTAVQSALEAKRHRSRLERMVGPRFSGRELELTRMDTWLDSGTGALVVQGTGGVGKTALVARFVQSRQVPFVWFDFDRMEVAPDDEDSLVAETIRQLSIQLPFEDRPTAPIERSPDALRRLAGSVVEAAGSGPHPSSLLLVMDSFEMAQYGGRHLELRPFLQTLTEALPFVRLLVSSRTPVEDLLGKGTAVTALKLEGLAPAAARDLLFREGLADEASIELILRVTRCVPLNLVLAVRLVKAGDTLEDLRSHLPAQLIEGYLYRRLLNRLSSERLRRVAHAALVLRRVSAELMFPVLGEVCDMSADEAPELFAALANEVALVEGGAVLRLRPDVRHSVLELLAAEDPQRVQTIDAAAERWYAQQVEGAVDPDPSAAPDSAVIAILREWQTDTTDPDLSAELVYHRLRLGDLEGAQAAWTDGCAPRMGPFAVDEVPESVRGWLREQLRGATALEPSLADWEADAARRIQDAAARHLWRLIPAIFSERSDRSPESPLPFFESWWRWREGDLQGARALIDRAGDASGAIGRNRAVLRAALLQAQGERVAAYYQLERVDADELWRHRSQGELEALAICASRLRLAVDLQGEAAFWRACLDSPRVAGLLALPDVLLLELRQLLQRSETIFEYSVESPLSETLENGVSAPSNGTVQYSALCEALTELYPEGRLDTRLDDAALTRSCERALRVHIGRTDVFGTDQDLSASARESERQTSDLHGMAAQGRVSSAAALLLCARIRRKLAKQRRFLPRVYELVVGGSNPDPRLVPGIFGQIAAFTGPGLCAVGAQGPADAAMAHWIDAHKPPQRVAPDLEPAWSATKQLFSRAQTEAAFDLSSLFNRLASEPYFAPFLLFITSESPLPRLVERLVEDAG